jgi:hypothetical protein
MLATGCVQAPRRTVTPVRGWDGAMLAWDAGLPYARGVWTDVWRVTEYEAFGLVLGIYITALQKEIYWQRWIDGAREAKTHQFFVELVFKTWRYFVTTCPDEATPTYTLWVATKLRCDPERVGAALEEAELWGLAESQ